LDGVLMKPSRDRGLFLTQGFRAERTFELVFIPE
jgi:hypothetical protein